MSFKRIDRSFLRFAVTLYVPGFLVQLGVGIVTPIMPLYARSFGISFALVGMVTTITAIGRILVNVPLGVVSDRVGRRPIVLLGMFLLALSGILCGIAQSFYELLAYRLLTGVSGSMCIIAYQAIIADAIDPSIRGRVGSTFTAVGMLGTSAGPAIGGIAAQIWNLRSPFFLFAGLCFSSFLGSLLLLKETMPREKGVKKPQSKKVGVSILGFLTFPILVAASANFVNSLRVSARMVLIPIYGDAALHLNTGEIGFIMSASTLAILFMTVPSGYIVDHWGRKAGLVPAFLLTGIVFALFPFTNDFMSLLAVAALLGVAVGLGGGAIGAIATDLAPTGVKATFMGFWWTIGDLGSAVGPVVLGYVADVLGMSLSFFITTAIMIISAVTTHLFVKETLTRAEEQKQV